MPEVEIYRRVETVETDVQAVKVKVEALGEGFEEITSLVRELAEGVSSLGRQLEASSVRSWLTVEDPEKAVLYLADLCKWLGEVWVHYDGAALPECWAYHPGVVEELLSLMDQHRAIFRKGGTSQQKADWHARYRPGVVERISKVAASCSLARHERGSEADPAEKREVPDGFDPAAIAASWTAGRQVPFAPTSVGRA